MTSSPSAHLDATFRIDERLRVIDRGGQSIVAISTDACTAEIALQGAQVLSWTPAGQADVLWCAPLPPAGAAKAIRGGVPICWPWFGPHANDPVQPQHGLVRTVDWRLSDTSISPDGIRVVFLLDAWGCGLELVVDAGPRLAIALSTHNTSATPVQLTEALHTYFHVGDVGRISIHGLEGLSFRDNTDAGRTKVQHGPCMVPAETIALFDSAPDACEIDDPVLDRRVRIVRTSGHSTIVWNPGAAAAKVSDIPSGGERQFVCIESGTISPNAITVAPGATHRLDVRYEMERR